MNTETRAEGRGFARSYIYAATGVFAVAGLVMLWAAWGDDLALMQPDRLFGCMNRTLLFVAGAWHLAVSGCLLFVRDTFNRGLVTLWAGWVYVVYGVAMLWVKTSLPFPLVQLVGWRIGANDPRIVGVFWVLFIVYLVAGGLLCVMIEHRRLKQLQSEAFLKRWRASRKPTSAE